MDPEARVLTFRCDAVSGNGRAGRLSTAHGEVETPAFMPVATLGSVKGVDAADLEALGARMVIMNTYHLWARPGEDVVKELGGLHELTRFRGPIVTDSGGFQAFSLASRVKVSEDGFRFASHIDGRKLELSPEQAMRIQGALGSDIAMQLDVCPAGGAPRDELALAVGRTTRWGERCLAAKNPGQALFGIVQGGTDIELRLEHAETLGRLPFDGLALGGFSVGEPNPAMHAALQAIGPKLDPLRPHYLMGVGTPADLVRAIGAGIDLFDCVIPTRNARNGQAFTARGPIALRNARYRVDPAPLDEDCPCPACRAGYSRAYLRHLHLAREMTAARLMTLHNLTFYARLVADARAAVVAGDYSGWASRTLASLEAADAPAPFPDGCE